MTMQEIIDTRRRLDTELVSALSTMNRKDTIFQLRQEIKAIQDQCPHQSAEFGWMQMDHRCPYCGKDLGQGGILDDLDSETK